MSAIADEMARSVIRLLQSTGETVTFRRVETGDYVPGTGTGTTDTPDDETVRLAFVKRNDQFARLLDQASGRTSVVTGERSALMSSVQSDGTAITKEPKAGDLLIGVGDTVKVVESRPIRVAGVKVAYICEVAE